jgi:hypothetical protein
VTDYSPVAGHPASVSAQAGATITGGQVVRLAVPALFPRQVEPTAGNAADSRTIGVAGNDAAVDALAGPQAVTVLTGSGVIHEGISGAPIAAHNVPLFTAALGRVAAAGGVQVGFSVAPSVPGWLPGSDPATDPPDFHRVRWLPSRT